MTYRQVPPEVYQQRVSELEQEVATLKEEGTINSVTEKSFEEFKKSSITAKMAVIVTVVLSAFLIAAYYIGIVRALMILWQIFMFFVAGIGIAFIAIFAFPYVLYMKLFKK